MKQLLKISDLLFNNGQIDGLPKNPRFIKDDKFKKLVKSIEENPEMLELRELLVYPYNDKYVVIGGNMRLRALKELGYKEVPCKVIPETASVEQLKAYTIKDNNGFGEWDFDLLANEWDLSDLENWGVDLPDLEEDEKEADIVEDEVEQKSLVDMFIVPPFSILDTRQGYWQDRKRLWKYLGIASEIGRKQNLIDDSSTDGYNSGLDTFAPSTSIFDPVVCELAYRWFCTEKGKIYDCFAGGSVRGIVASKLGYDYHGIDLRQEQVDANIKNANEIGVNTNWYCDDSLNADKYIEDNSCDMIFSCPPYADLEVYSDDPRDISNMDYENFCKVYAEIIAIACRKLKQDRFAVFVVGDVRDKKGFYINFVDYTKKCFKNNGLLTYNELILVEQIGTGGLRANNYMKNRKVIKTHQNILVFYKGNPKNIKANYPEIEIDDSVFDDKN